MHQIINYFSNFDFSIPSILSWAACFLLLLGLKLIGDKKLAGFYIATFAEILWIIWGCITFAPALIIMSVVITIMYIRAIYLWSQGENK